jgi:hypothetical protein
MLSGNFMKMQSTFDGAGQELSDITTGLLPSLMVSCNKLRKLLLNLLGPSLDILADVTSVSSCLNRSAILLEYASPYFYVCCNLHNALVRFLSAVSG